MMEAWSNFAKYGNPNGASRALHQIGWPQFSGKHVLKIGTLPIQNKTLVLKAIIQENDQENCAFWNLLIPKLSQIYHHDCRVSKIDFEIFIMTVFCTFPGYSCC